MESTVTKPKIDYKDDLRQAASVGKYEVMKFLSGKKILIFGILNVLVLGLTAAILFIFNTDGLTTEDGIVSFISFSSLLMLIGATLFSSVTLVSEFEERTSLMLFTKPIRKSSIFLGKFLAAYFLNMAFVIFYYIVAAIIIAIKTGGFTANIFPSLGYCALYIFSLTGIATLFSALMKKSSSASILTFVFILLVPSIIEVIILAATASGGSIETWYILNDASNSVINSISGPVANGLRDAFVMIVWGLIPALAAYFLFRKREV